MGRARRHQTIKAAQLRKRPPLAASRPSRIPPLLISITIGLLLCGICGALYYQEAGSIEKNLLDREVLRTETLAQLYEGDISDTAKDLRQLVDGDGLQSLHDLGGSSPTSTAPSIGQNSSAS